jgi:hypothetical protein
MGVNEFCEPKQEFLSTNQFLLGPASTEAVSGPFKYALTIRQQKYYCIKAAVILSLCIR